MTELVKSPFYHDWEDRAEADRFQVHAREIFNHLKAYQHASRSGHMDYGKWVIASMLAVHGGAIYAISSLRTSVRHDQVEGLITAAAWNLGGVLMILIAGFFAWLNLQCLERQYDKWADPAMLYRSDKFPTAEHKTDPVSATLLLAASFGILSGYAFAVSAVTVIAALRAF